MPTETSTRWPGLSQSEAALRLEMHGPNELPAARPKSLWAIFLEVMHEPMFLLLIAGSILYWLLGDVHEALMMGVMILGIVGITFYQEQKTERALEALRTLASPRVRVMRDGVQQRVPGREVVPGDVLLLEEGDRVPADGVLIGGMGLSVDESVLTGESVPVRRHPARDEGDGEAALFSGTLVVSGNGVARAEKTGMRTQIGEIGLSLNSLATEPTELQRETGRLVKFFGLWGGLLCILVIVAYGLTRGNWLEGVLAGIALAMSVLPEEFPVVLTLFMTLGAWRIARNQVLTRRAQAIETLGSASVLCVDKTGTLTQNRMSLNELATPELLYRLDPPETGSLPADCERLLGHAVLASQPEGLDPMDQAVREAFHRWLPGRGHPHAQGERVQVYPLSPERMALVQVWEGEALGGRLAACKGAPEAVMALCRMPKSAQADVMARIDRMSGNGLRVLAVAYARPAPGAPLPEAPEALHFEYLGLLGFEDPVRPTVPEAIRTCRQAGIRVIMMTGDYPNTARHVARRIGLENPEAVLTGPELAGWDEATLQARLEDTHVFARMVPAQKLRLITLLKGQRQVVAMTGDGVNDAPALKAAHIGIAMGARGTDVAREAADLVLLDDDFSSIVKAVRMGRRIFDNLRKALGYIFAVHIPIAGLALAPVLLKWPLILLPVQIVFMELVIDPACTIAFEAEPAEKDLMRRPPRRLHEPLFTRHTFLVSSVQGTVVFLTVLGLYAWLLATDASSDHARTMAFAALVSCNLALIATSLSWAAPVTDWTFLRNRAFLWVAGLTAAAMVAVLQIPGLRQMFGFTPLSWQDGGLCLLAGLLCLALLESGKTLTLAWLRRRRCASPGGPGRLPPGPASPDNRRRPGHSPPVPPPTAG